MLRALQFGAGALVWGCVVGFPFVLVLLVVALLAGLLFFTPRGRVLLERARGRRAEATPRSYFEMEGGPEPAGGLTVTTENKMLA